MGGDGWGGRGGGEKGVRGGGGDCERGEGVVGWGEGEKERGRGRMYEGGGMGVGDGGGVQSLRAGGKERWSGVEWVRVGLVWSRVTERGQSSNDSSS